MAQTAQQATNGIYAGMRPWERDVELLKQRKRLQEQQDQLAKQVARQNEWKDIAGQAALAMKGSPAMLAGLLIGRLIRGSFDHHYEANQKKKAEAQATEMARRKEFADKYSGLGLPQEAADEYIKTGKLPKFTGGLSYTPSAVPKEQPAASVTTEQSAATVSTPQGTVRDISPLKVNLDWQNPPEYKADFRTLVDKMLAPRPNDRNNLANTTVPFNLNYNY